jgi:hypothetical protein
MKRSELKQSIREEIIDILEAASKEDIANQKELNKELEKTAKLAADLSEGNDSDKFMDDGYVDHKYDDSTIDKYNIPVAQTAVFEEDDDEPSSKDIKASSKDSISKIASKLQQISSEMKSTAKKWKASEGDEKMKLRDRLVKLTKIKKELESLL